MYGYDSLVSDFKRLADAREFSHAYLLFGPDGAGKFLLAQSLAHYLERSVFEKPNVTLSETHIVCAGNDAHEEGEDAGVSGIDAIRELERFLYQHPVASPYRVALIRDIHRLNTIAQNALLKTLEEPPDHALIIATASDPSAILPTISSRFLKIHMGPLSDTQILDFLSKYDIIDAPTVQLCANQSAGCIGRAISFLENHTTKRQRESHSRLETLAQRVVRGTLSSADAIESVIDDLLEYEHVRPSSIFGWMEVLISQLRAHPIEHARELGALCKTWSLLATTPVNKRLALRSLLWDMTRPRG